MTLTFLGTAAANAFPEAFCWCDNCRRARELGGPSLRKRSAALINDDLLIDLGPDIMTSSIMHGYSLSQVKYCLQTHAHADHLDASHLLSRSPGYGVLNAPPLHFYASPGTLRVTAQLLERDCAPHNLLQPNMCKHLNVEIHQVEPFQSFTMGSYQVTVLPANHDPAVESLLYAVGTNGRTIFYGTDTGVLSEETWKAFHQRKLQFDVVVLDHTYGPYNSGTDHLNASQFIEHVTRMREEGLLTKEGRAFATHIAHSGNPPHPELAEFARDHGYEVAYDGLTV